MLTQLMTIGNPIAEAGRHEGGYLLMETLNPQCSHLIQDFRVAFEVWRCGGNVGQEASV